MDAEREICLCFHVKISKLMQYVRVARPQRASQLSDCCGAGTGCGWCRPYLQQLFDSACDPESLARLPAVGVYESARRAYRAQQSGTGTGDD